MGKFELDLDVDQQQEQGGVIEQPQLSGQEERKLKIQRCIRSLAHATHCREPTCQLASCAKMKRVVEHTKTCRRKTGGGCRICQELIHLCCYHAKRCLERECVVPFCRHSKLKLRLHQTQQRFAQSQTLRRRMMQRQSMQPPPQMPGQPNAMMPGVQQQFPQMQPGQQGMQNPMQQGMHPGMPSGVSENMPHAMQNPMLQMPIVSQANVSQQNQGACGIYKFV